MNKQLSHLLRNKREEFKIDVHENYYDIRHENETGVGSMRCMEVFPHIVLSFNRYDLEHVCTSISYDNDDMLMFECCLDGRLEWIRHNKALYLEPGDIHSHDQKSHAGLYSFPTKYYRSIALMIKKKNYSDLKEKYDVDIERIFQKFKDGLPYYLYYSERLFSIFQAMDTFQELSKIQYYRLKVLEFLLELERYDISQRVYKKYIGKRTIERAKKIQQFILSSVDNAMTMEDIKNHVNYSSTTIKNCFKEVYGSSIYAYLKKYKMKKAADYLLNSDDSIASVASIFGYENPSKFSAAFKSVMMCTPSQYRLESEQYNVSDK